MDWEWGTLTRKSIKWLKAGWLGFAVLTAFYVGMVEPRNFNRMVNSERATGLAAVSGGDSLAFLHTRIATNTFDAETMSRIAGIPKVAVSPNRDSTSESAAEDRKLIRTAAMDLLVKNPTEVAEKIRLLAEQAGGFVVASRIRGSRETSHAALTIRVPVPHFQEVRAEIRKLGLRVDNDNVEAEDVTRNYVDREARLRNLRATEQQYLEILRRAITIKDTLAVSENLNGVRGQIEQQQAEFQALSKQVETVAISVSLVAQEDAKVLGLQWRPLYRLKLSAREGMNGVADYLGAMTEFLFYLPTILLWLATFLIGAAAGWKILRWVIRVLFSRNPSATETGAN